MREIIKEIGRWNRKFWLAVSMPGIRWSDRIKIWGTALAFLLFLSTIETLVCALTALLVCAMYLWCIHTVDKDAMEKVYQRIEEIDGTPKGQDSQEEKRERTNRLTVAQEHALYHARFIVASYKACKAEVWRTYITRMEPDETFEQAVKRIEGDNPAFNFKDFRMIEGLKEANL
jgi:hypothetical protein